MAKAETLRANGWSRRDSEGCSKGGLRFASSSFARGRWKAAQNSACQPPLATPRIRPATPLKRRCQAHTEPKSSRANLHGWANQRFKNVRRPPFAGLARWAFGELAQRLPVPRMWNLRARASARAGRERESRRLADLLEREAVELRHDLAFEPCLVALFRMPARQLRLRRCPSAIARRPCSRRPFGMHASQ